MTVKTQEVSKPIMKQLPDTWICWATRHSVSYTPHPPSRVTWMARWAGNVRTCLCYSLTCDWQALSDSVHAHALWHAQSSLCSRADGLIHCLVRLLVQLLLYQIGFRSVPGNPNKNRNLCFLTNMTTDWSALSWKQGRWFKMRTRGGKKWHEIKTRAQRSEVRGMAPYLCFSSSLCDDLKDTGGICVSTLEAPEHRGDTLDEIQTTEGSTTKVKGPSFDGLISF